MGLWSDCSHTKTKVVATKACGNTQLCAGLRSGIEANLHAVQAIWPQSAGWTEDLGVEEEEEEEEDGDPRVNATLRRVHADGLLALNVDPGVAEYDCHSCYEAESGFGSALFDARNGFYELNRYLMLWNVACSFRCQKWLQQVEPLSHALECGPPVEPGELVRIQPLPAIGSLLG